MMNFLRKRGNGKKFHLFERFILSITKNIHKYTYACEGVKIMSFKGFRFKVAVFLNLFQQKKKLRLINV